MKIDSFSCVFHGKKFSKSMLPKRLILFQLHSDVTTDDVIL